MLGRGWQPVAADPMRHTPIRPHTRMAPTETSFRVALFLAMPGTTHSQACIRPIKQDRLPFRPWLDGSDCRLAGWLISNAAANVHTFCALHGAHSPSCRCTDSAGQPQGWSPQSHMEPHTLSSSKSTHQRPQMLGHTQRRELLSGRRRQSHCAGATDATPFQAFSYPTQARSTLTGPQAGPVKKRIMILCPPRVRRG